MQHSLVIFAIAWATSINAMDVLRFTNGDQLHGSFGGIAADHSLLWKRSDLKDPLNLQTDQVRHILLDTTETPCQACSFSFVTLSNGDQVPGEVIRYSQDAVVIRSSALGEITLPPSQIRSIHAQPIGGTLHYLGPYSSKGWEVLSTKDSHRPGEAKVEVKPAPSPADPSEAKKHPTADKAWIHAGTAWYHTHGIQPLARKNCLGDCTMLRFRLSWRERLNVNIALHADFAKPPAAAEDAKKKEEADAPKRMAFFNGMPQNQVQLFGNALILNIYQTYFSLNRCGYDAQGQIISQRMMHTQSNVELPESGDAVIEIRSDRRKGLLMLFLNGQYAAQWEDIEQLMPSTPSADASDDPPLGHGFAIQATNSQAPLRLSDFVIADWNGIKDSADSLHHDQRDIILLNNGTDRYSGELRKIENGTVHFQSAFSSLQIPLNQVAEITLARSSPIETSDTAENMVTARFYPIGKISGIIRPSSSEVLELQSPLGSSWRVNLTHAIALDFHDDNPFLETMEAPLPRRITPQE